MLVICQLCKKKDTDKKEMSTIDNKKGYFHSHCIDAENERQAFLDREREEKDSLVDEIVRIHKLSGRQSIPPRFYSDVLEPFRSDNVVRQKINKRYKEGFDYKTILDTYLYLESNKIKAFLTKKELSEGNGIVSIFGELKYVFKIVSNNIENMIRAKRKKQNSKVRKEKVLEGAKEMMQISGKLREKRNNLKLNPKVKDESQIDYDDLFDEEGNFL